MIVMLRRLEMPSVLLAAAIVLLFCSTVSPVHASDGTGGLTEAADDAISKLEAEDDLDIVYLPPVTGAPADRIGAGTRGAGTRIPLLELLAPKKGGYTYLASPKLYWWLPKSFTGTVEINVDANRGDKRPLTFTKDLKNASGLQVIDLEELGYLLDEGAAADGPIYLWRVLLKNPNGIAILSKFSYVQRIHKPEDIAEEDAAKRAKRLAKAGIWYDALSELSENGDLAALRASLLKSAGIELKGTD